ncbi:MAG: hypothetical protein IIA48_06710 [Bacteroidetes bacterium]|nr:hypothetical protein [Bacteroidota bacterium]
MKKTKQETLNDLNNELSSIENLYKSGCVNWIGKTKDTDEFYSEIISNELLLNLKEFDKISIVTRKNTYCRANHKKIEINLESPRKEEIFAKRLAYLNLGELGEIKDYQIPLKDTKADKGLGKIDLISYNDETKILYLIELKYEGSDETLLRASLESYTYFKIVDKTKLIKDCFNNSIHPDEIKVMPAVLVVPNCNACDELEDVEIGNRPKFKALALALGIKFFTLELLVNDTIL